MGKMTENDDTTYIVKVLGPNLELLKLFANIPILSNGTLV